MGKIFSNLIIL